MMSKFYITFLVILCGIMTFSCSSGKKQLERGDYYDAVIRSINRLRANPNQRKAQETLQDAYPLAVKWYLNRSKNMVSSNDPFKWKTVVTSYERLNHMYDEIQRSPGALRVVPNPSNYYSELVDARKNAAEESYNAGLVALELNTRESAKKAYYHFMDADRFAPGYKEVNNKLAESKFIATLKVVVEQIPVPTRRYQLSAQFFQQNVEEFLHSFNPNEFVRYYSPKEAESERLEYPDQIIRLQFDDFVVGETHVKETIETLVKENVKVGELEVKKDSVVDVYGDVKAKLTMFKKEVISEGVLNMIIVDAQSKSILSSEKIGGQFVWFSQWGNFNGDERALTEEQLKICKQSEVPPPPPQDLFIEFTRPIFDQLSAKIRNFYKYY
ncbi:hypothetical protein QQ008_29635 [Fulvivirgaceae bacterium BMA10]|uniref:Lipoprotein n=1 Tax=Splendidivirga corallicola TaxID=3051826 RepID=A0ABT8KZM9_9BACT|nr:hypothetical protein [Fulvivirgaceae bacterium BMA10]